MSDESASEESGSEGTPPEKWLTVLEETAAAPWLKSVPPDHEDKLKRAFMFLFEIILYLGRPPIEEGGAEQFLLAFGSAIVPPDSEIGRARRATTTLTRAVVQDISAVPVSSSLREEKSEIFNTFGALQALHDTYLLNGEEEAEISDWVEFWSRAEPILLNLAMKLDDAGFGLDLGKEKEAKQNENNGQHHTGDAKKEHG